METKPEKDKCVLCWHDTEYDIDTPIDERIHYVVGCGQLCEKCWNETYGTKKEIELIESEDCLPFIDK